MNELEVTIGTIFNVQHYSIHDGPGIRTTVFLKGCPLRCLWCQNPESQTTRPELFFNSEKCTGCADCVPVCPQHAIAVSDGRSWTDRELCNGAGKCAKVCPNEARNVMGRQVTAGEVFREVNGDSIFYQHSGGGMTVSGGDPVAQPRFVAALLRLCKEAGLHTTIDTSGYARWETFQPILEYTDLVLLDFKHMDPQEHEKLTGVSNELILENAKKIHHQLAIPLLARVPVVPGYNDSEQNITAMARFVATELGPAVRVHLLPYHRLGEAKYERMELPGNGYNFQVPDDDHMTHLQSIVETFGLTAVIGG